MDRAPRAREPPAREGAAEARLQERVQEHLVQLHARARLHSDEAIDSEPLPPGQVWAVGPGGGETGPGLYRIEVTAQPGAGVRILNQPTPPAFRESVKVAEQNLYAQARGLVGDRDPRAHEFTVQLRAMDADKSGALLGVPALVALSGAMLGKNTRGSTIIVGAQTRAPATPRDWRSAIVGRTLVMDEARLCEICRWGFPLISDFCLPGAYRQLEFKGCN